MITKIVVSLQLLLPMCPIPFVWDTDQQVDVTAAVQVSTLDNELDALVNRLFAFGRKHAQDHVTAQIKILKMLLLVGGDWVAVKEFIWFILCQFRLHFLPATQMRHRVLQQDEMHLPFEIAVLDR